MERSAARRSKRQPGGDSATRAEPVTPGRRVGPESNDRCASGPGRACRPPTGALRPGLPVGPGRHPAISHHQVPRRCRPQNGQRVGCGELLRGPQRANFIKTRKRRVGVSQPYLLPTPGDTQHGGGASVSSLVGVEVGVKSACWRRDLFWKP